MEASPPTLGKWRRGCNMYLLPLSQPNWEDVKNLMELVPQLKGWIMESPRECSYTVTYLWRLHTLHYTSSQLPVLYSTYVVIFKSWDISSCLSFPVGKCPFFLSTSRSRILFALVVLLPIRYTNTSSKLFIMGLFGGERYYGLRGNKLNAAINIVAGLDFLYVIFCDSNWTRTNEPSFDSFSILRLANSSQPFRLWSRCDGRTLDSS